MQRQTDKPRRKELVQRDERDKEIAAVVIRREERLDEALEESFPASDPPSIMLS